MTLGEILKKTYTFNEKQTISGLSLSTYKMQYFGRPIDKLFIPSGAESFFMSEIKKESTGQRG